MGVSPCRVAVVGAGPTAREHARAFSDVVGTELVGIYSRTPSKAEAIAEELDFGPAYRSLEDLLKEARPDLVVIAVSVESMFEVAERCLASSAALLLEKPPGLDLQQAESLLSLTKDREPPVLVGLNRRFYSSTQGVLEGVGDRGERLVFVSDQQDRAEAIAAGASPVVVENWMYANCIHLVDYLSIFCRGDAQTVRHTSEWDPTSPVLVACEVTFSSGDRGLYRCVWDRPASWAVTVCTPDIEWDLRPLETGRMRDRSRRVLELESDGVDRTFKPGFRRQAEEAVRAARGEPSRATHLEEAVETMRLIARIYGLVR